MEIIRSAKYRLYPSAKQKSLLHNLFGSTRLTYNLFLCKIQESYFGTSLNKKTGELVPKIPSEFDLSKALTIFKSDYPFLYTVPNMFLQAESKNLSSAYKKFFSGGGYPKFKSRKDKHQSINCYQGMNAKFDFEYIFLLYFYLILPYLHNILLPKMFFDHICILSLHDFQISLMHFCPLDTP